MEFDLGQLVAAFPLPWSAYVRLLSVKSENACAFYESGGLTPFSKIRLIVQPLTMQLSFAIMLCPRSSNRHGSRRLDTVDRHHWRMTMKPSLVFTSALVTVLVSLTATAAVYNVRQDGVGDFTNIQAALDVTIDGDEVIVHPGLYIENLTVWSNVNLHSLAPTNDATVSSTVIEAADPGGNVVRLYVGDDTRVAGFTLTNGSRGIHYGGGASLIEYNRITCMRESGISDCGGTIRHNTISWNDGGGLRSCYGTIEHNIISLNNGYGLRSCSGTIEHNIISLNTGWNGGGLRECHGIIHNNLIVDNIAQYGGGLYNCRAYIANNTITRNVAIYDGGGVHADMDSDVGVFNCIIWGNLAGEYSQIVDAYVKAHYCCIEDGRITNDNINANPLFVSEHDFHLTVDSLCINAGFNLPDIWSQTDLDGDPRVKNGTVDIGCYEYTVTQALMRVSSFVLDFGDVALDETNQLILTVKNIGPEALEGELLYTVSPFHVVTGSPYWIQPISDAPVQFDFIPTGFGSVTNTVTLTGGRGATVTLIGVGIPEPAATAIIALVGGIALWSRQSVS